MLITSRWNVVGALHKPDGKIEYEKVHHGHVNVVFSWSSRAILIDCNHYTHPEKRNNSFQLECLELDL